MYLHTTNVRLTTLWTYGGGLGRRNFDTCWQFGFLPSKMRQSAWEWRWRGRAWSIRTRFSPSNVSPWRSLSTRGGKIGWSELSSLNHWKKNKGHGSNWKLMTKSRQICEKRSHFRHFFEPEMKQTTYIFKAREYHIANWWIIFVNYKIILMTILPPAVNKLQVCI